MGNSVIYQPAYDAEVEYLESDGNSYIDTGLKASSELGILAEMQYVSGYPFAFGGADGLLMNEYGFLCKGGIGESSFRFGNYANQDNPAINNQKLLFDNRTNHNKLYVGDVLYDTAYQTFTSAYNFYLFAECRGGNITKGGSIRIYDFKIYQNSTLVRDFIPVRIGSVGYLYDKVTKQLFANKGTGNFILGNDVSNAVIPQQRCVLYFGNQRSVGYERIYEEYDWLKVQTTTRTGTYLTLSLGTSMNFSFKRVWLSDFWNTWYFYTPGYVYYTDNHRLVAIWDSTNSVGVDSGDTSTINVGDVITIESTPDLLLINGKTINRYNYVSGAVSLTNATAREITSLTSSITVDGSVRYVPCKLLQSIPAILDGNGIARQAGECGMWDKVSNRFYGNVASSGSFTVSND